MYMMSPWLNFNLRHLVQSTQRSRWHKKVLRCLYSKTGVWDGDFTIETRKELENYWRDHLALQNQQSSLSKQDDRDKFYVLSMFPYPSGKLHMGHVRVYTISDTIAHFHRLNGKQVLHPMGWDSFGLPAENAAIDRGLQPADWTHSNIDYMRRQLKQLSFCFNWEREVTTCLPDYYRWTQSIFVRLLEAGLAYQKEAVVNWDPVDQTVLAKEQVDENGCSWRSGAKVEQRLLKQWFLKMTHYSKSLLEGLDDLPDWPSGIKSMQANWMGDCSGCAFSFRLQLPSASEESISVHTQYPELIYGASHVILAPTHTLLKKPEFIQNLTEEIRTKLEQLESERTDVDLGVQVLHPFTQQPVPLFASSRKTFEENVESHLGIPCSGEEEDVEFVHQHGISYEKVLDGGRIVNSDQLSRLSRDEARSSIMEHARELGIGGHMTSPRQFDWLISRQRYWGTPIPVIHCPTCKAVPVPHTELPVTLPKLDSLSGKGLSPLENQADWINTRCPKCGGAAKRETDTMDTFVDSSWYYLRYTDSTNQKEAFGKENADWLLPVDVYVGGKEHAIMHLLYARFINHFLHDQGLVAHKEPFKRLLVQGLVMGQSYRVTSTGKYITPDQVDHSGSAPVQKGTGEELAVKWEKMSKSKYNGVDPEGAIEEFGVDTVRLFILSGIPPDLDMMWNVEAITGVVRWKNRMWGLVTRFYELRSDSERNDTSLDKEQHVKLERDLEVQLNKAIEDVTTHFGSDYMLSVAISRLMTMTNQLRAYPDDFIKNSVAFQDALGSLCIMVAPMAPLIASEMWQGIGGAGYAKDSRWDWTKTVLEQRWPSVTECNQVSLDTVELVIKINNKTSGKVSVPASLLENKEELERFILDSELGRKQMASKTINKMIVAAKVPLVNFLTR
ncbi:probable leucine--tRNA ligase, mitochondrial [Strongylocentrotus purpuratus]|uniref:leucine--tRNA ligase n=1 Tax=Strongylocentrotus purpuratus TaxID=7668 RepID=A0A7M7N4J6_STRPU|nr:probable leucine--tRNA ligase, mitochondrial [Strongylocentrotus purpuratus]